MAFVLVDCIHSSLHHLDLVVDMMPPGHWHLLLLKLVRFRLRSLKMFALCARKLGNDISLGSFLATIEDTVRRNAEKIHIIHLDFDSTGRANLKDAADKFEEDIARLYGGLDEWYATLLDTTRQSSPFTTNEVLEIIGSFQENLVEF
ncbi:OLC1v1031768C1 [Oldenlandia corymbosa var. corymbosa]|uniref:OLC1v1031768C1 n=1 Tax=Oldenlandia corymbosa var. corymbosa TaxID=529605 RepID=A0AAV1CMJ2_OLDCO|nr:OLC1v1031768C1 [Oldenlandia corymbosa var. corymbosa]